MNDLQIGLAILGVLMVAAVLLFNWLQERKFRRRGEEAFPEQRDDVLLRQAATPAPPGLPPLMQQYAEDESRIEPRMEPQLDSVSEARAPGLAPAVKVRTAGVPHPAIDYIAELRAGEFIATEKLERMQQSLPSLTRRISFSGLNYQSKAWEPLRDDGTYTSVRIALQLADRSGPVSAEHLRTFGETVKNTAGEIAAIAELPDFAPALERAAALDKFCADVDVVVGINVVANSGQVFQGTKIRALAEAAGLHLQEGGAFHCHDEQSGTLFSVDNQGSDPFLIDRIRNITTAGITFLLDVPRVANGPRVFDKMVGMSRSFADSLDGTLADDNRVLLNDAGLDRIRAQLRAIYAAMEQRGIEAGSPLALRLFS